MPTMRVNERPMRRHTHKPNGHAREDTERCPWCGSAISRAEFERIRQEVAEQERVRLAKAERALHERFKSELNAAKEKAVQAERTSAAKKIAEATKAATAAEQQLKKAAAERDAIVKARVEAEREAAAGRIAAAVNAEKVRAYAEKTKLTEQLEGMKRRLEQRTAHQLGEPAEIDLFVALETAFPDDSVTRVARGKKGPDVVQTVIHGGAPVGKIVFDSKNYSPRRWSNAMTKKLRADQLAEGADFAILCSSVFPAGAEELFLQDNVIVASPQRIVVLTHLLRRQIVENHRLHLTAAARDEKAERLLAYIISPTCTDLLDRIVGLTRDLTDLDRVETAAHQKNWIKRADLIRALHAIHEEFSSTVSGIIAGEQGAAA